MKIQILVLLAFSFRGVAAQPTVGPAFGTTNAPTTTLTRSNLAQASRPFFRTLSVPGLGPPMLLNTNWALRTRVSGLENPIAVAFLAADDFLVIEKDTGRVKRFRPNGAEEIVLDLAVNSASERGLLGIALHPDFPSNPGVYLFWSCRAPGPVTPHLPFATTCPDPPELGPDSKELLETPLLGNRVDRFVWTGQSLTFERNLIKLRSFQNDSSPIPFGQSDGLQPPRGNHNGGVLRFGPDGKLYILCGDVGRRGVLQNLPAGPTETGGGATVQDDQFGGPDPDDAHLTGVILRLNGDGSTPADNPFFSLGASLGGQVGQNLQRIYVYGLRNSFGMDFDPRSGQLWFQENGEDAFDEINRAVPGMNSGWIQVIGPLDRISQYKSIETTALHHDDFPNLQQFRWGPERIANTPAQATARLLMLPGARYQDPEFSWKNVMAPAAIGFLRGNALGAGFNGDLFVGFSVPDPLGGPLMRFDIGGDPRRIVFSDSRLADRVADNQDFHEITESESLVVGTEFGVITDIQTAPNGNLIVVSLSQGAVYEISRRQGQAP